MGNNVVTRINMVETQCYCGLPVLAPPARFRQFEQEGKNIHCALGHTFVIGGETENAELKQRVRGLKEQLARERIERKAAEEAAMREVKKRKRLEKRAKDGLCPHCSRTFKNLKNHMLPKHCGPKEAKRVADEMKRKKAKKKEAA